MGPTEPCSKCGHENPCGFKFCNECGKSRNPQTTAIPFPTRVDIHEDADLHRVAVYLFGNAEYVPSVAELREALNSLATDNMRQCFIRVMRLHLPGVQDQATYLSIAAGRNGSSSAVRTAFGRAGSRINEYLQKARRRELNRLKAEEDLANVAE